MKKYFIKNRFLRENLVIALKLTAICFISVLFLGVVNLVTKDKIAENDAELETSTNSIFFPEADEFIKKEFSSAVDSTNNGYYYEVKESTDALLGYTVKITGSGYGGDMVMMIAYNQDQSIKQVKLLQNSETPGFGKRAEKDEYMNMFAGKSLEKKSIPRSRNDVAEKYRDSITGATITFSGLTEAVKRASTLLKNELEK